MRTISISNESHADAKILLSVQNYTHRDLVDYSDKFIVDYSDKFICCLVISIYADCRVISRKF